MLPMEAKEASKALHEAGIPGIKYLDQGSRVDPGTVSLFERHLKMRRSFLKRIQMIQLHKSCLEHLKLGSKM